MKAIKFIFILLFGLGSIGGVSADQCPPLRILSFEEAVYRTLSSSPRLRVSAAEVQMRCGEKIQSGLYPNPTFAYSVEDIWGNHDWRGWRNPETRYEIDQTIVTAGKLDYRQKSAKFQYYASLAENNVVAIQLLNQLMRAYVEVVATQEQFKIAQDQRQINFEILNIVGEKVQAGKVSIMQQKKAEIAFSNAEIAMEVAKVNLRAAKDRLALMWASTCPDFDFVNFDYFNIEVPMPLNYCIASLRNNPELIRSHYEYLASRQTLKYERVVPIPDVTVLVGYKTERELRYNRGFVLGASIPLPVFDQNQGNILRAKADVARARGLYCETRLLLETKLLLAHRELVRSYEEAELLRSTVLKSAVESLEYANEGYKEGKFEYLDMLDSQRTLFEVRERYILSLLNYHLSRADIEYLNTQVE